MSKSKGNFLTLRTACPTSDDVRAYRYLVVSSQYRNPLSFTDTALGAAKKALKRLDKLKIMVVDALSKENGANIAYGVDSVDSNIATAVERELANFEVAIADDLSMPRASASLFSIVKVAENEFKRVTKAADDPDFSVMPPLDLVGLASVKQALEKMDTVFGIFYDVPEEKGGSDDGVSVNGNQLLVPDDVMQLVAQRSAAKDAKDWGLADSLRSKITALGFEVKDVKGGDPIISRNDELLISKD
jgi:cysteinyl-tRNA synthetase